MKKFLSALLLVALYVLPSMNRMHKTADPITMCGGCGGDHERDKK